VRTHPKKGAYANHGNWRTTVFAVRNYFIEVGKIESEKRNEPL